MRITKRLTIFVLTGLMTFLIGVFVTRYAPDLWVPSVTNCPVQVHLTYGPSPWLVLLSFEHRDLKSLDKESERTLRKAIDSLRGKVDSETSPLFEPRLFQRISNTAGQQRYLLVEVANLMIIPGDSFLRIHVFAADGRVLNVEEFAVRRELLTDIHVRKVIAMQHEVLMINTVYCLGGHKTRQFFSLVGNGIRLVYKEQDGWFDATRTATLTPRVQRPVDEWEKALHSDDDVEVMLALVWLNENHWAGRPMQYDDTEGEKTSTLLARKQVRRRLQALSESENPWKRTAARYILNALVTAPSD
jgi:hypothetical protein